MSWSVSELDKNKTEQAISNEEARLDMCRVELDKLIRERDRYKIEKITRSIDCGETFVKECKEHLNDFD